MGELEVGGWSRGEVASVLVAPAVACPQAGRPVSGLGRGRGGVCRWTSGQGAARGVSAPGAEPWLQPWPAPLAWGRAGSVGSAWGSVWLLQAGGPGFPASVLPPAAAIAAKKPLGAGAADPPLPQASSTPARPRSPALHRQTGPLGPRALVMVATGSSLQAELTYGEARSPGEVARGHAAGS